MPAFLFDTPAKTPEHNDKTASMQGKNFVGATASVAKSRASRNLRGRDVRSYSSSCQWNGLADMHGGATFDLERSIDQTQVAEPLREVAEQSAVFGMNLLAQKPQRRTMA